MMSSPRISARVVPLLLALLSFLTTDNVEFYLTNTFWLDEVCKTLILIPCVAIFLKFHCLFIEVRMLLVEPYPLYLLLEEAEVATRTATAISAHFSPSTSKGISS